MDFRRTLSGYFQDCERALAGAEEPGAARDAQCPVLED
jgi:hypothetical protein